MNFSFGKMALMGMSSMGALLNALADRFDSVKTALSTNIHDSSIQCVAGDEGEWEVGNVLGTGMVILGIIEVAAIGGNIIRYYLTKNENKSITPADKTDLQKVATELRNEDGIKVTLADAVTKK